MSNLKKLLFVLALLAGGALSGTAVIYWAPFIVSLIPAADDPMVIEVIWGCVYCVAMVIALWLLFFKTKTAKRTVGTVFLNIGLSILVIYCVVGYFVCCSRENLRKMSIIGTYGKECVFYNRHYGSNYYDRFRKHIFTASRTLLGTALKGNEMVYIGYSDDHSDEYGCYVYVQFYDKNFKPVDELYIMVDSDRVIAKERDIVNYLREQGIVSFLNVR
ncbi:MAG: hypothetical protein K2N28_08910 [Muribaculaceae bacterium]|nr:hypothetical protein [Muribaculaceae bacterium]